MYPDAAPSTDLSVQPTIGGAVRSLITLKDSKAPTNQRFDLNLPAGSELAATADGGYEIVDRIDADTSVAIGAIDAPWAKDAVGNDVPTTYRLEGNTLIQQIHVTSSTAFPVVADPSVSFGRGIYVKFNRSETSSIAPYSDAASAVGMPEGPGPGQERARADDLPWHPRRFRPERAEYLQVRREPGSLCPNPDALRPDRYRRRVA
ncbi:hypothetical protein [Streptomyces sp. NPDC060010]|uniref:hypothetical protein n=1 Tax=Streptomyces sp. NPDC060010 TaxID=3347036 RepID=UPI0036A53439